MISFKIHQSIAQISIKIGLEFRPSPSVCGVQMKTIKFDLQSPMDTPFGGACSDFFQMASCGFLCGKIDFSCKKKNKIKKILLFLLFICNFFCNNNFRVRNVSTRRFEFRISFPFRRIDRRTGFPHLIRTNLQLLIS